MFSLSWGISEWEVREEHFVQLNTRVRLNYPDIIFQETIHTAQLKQPHAWDQNSTQHFFLCVYFLLIYCSIFDV